MDILFATKGEGDRTWQGERITKKGRALEYYQVAAETSFSSQVRTKEATETSFTGGETFQNRPSLRGRNLESGGRFEGLRKWSRNFCQAGGGGIDEDEQGQHPENQGGGLSEKILKGGGGNSGAWL